MSVEEHRQQGEGLEAVVQVVVVSSSRTEAEDQSGLVITEILEEAGCRVLARHVIPDDVQSIRQLLSEFAVDGETNLVVLTGGTGITASDVTPEAIEPLLDTRMPGFGEIFRFL